MNKATLSGKPLCPPKQPRQLTDAQQAFYTKICSPEEDVRLDALNFHLQGGWWTQFEPCIMQMMNDDTNVATRMEAARHVWRNLILDHRSGFLRDLHRQRETTRAALVDCIVPHGSATIRFGLPALLSLCADPDSETAMDAQEGVLETLRWADSRANVDRCPLVCQEDPTLARDTAAAIAGGMPWDPNVFNAVCSRTSETVATWTFLGVLQDFIGEVNSHLADARAALLVASEDKPWEPKTPDEEVMCNLNVSEDVREAAAKCVYRDTVGDRRVRLWRALPTLPAEVRRVAANEIDWDDAELSVYAIPTLVSLTADPDSVTAARAKQHLRHLTEFRPSEFHLHLVWADDKRVAARFAAEVLAGRPWSHDIATQINQLVYLLHGETDMVQALTTFEANLKVAIADLRANALPPAERRQTKPKVRL